MPIGLMLVLSLVTAITGTIVLRLAMQTVAGTPPGLRYILMFFAASFVAQFIILIAFVGTPPG